MEAPGISEFTSSSDTVGALAPPEWRLVAAAEHIALLALDATGRILAWSAGAERVTGLAERALRGQSLAPLYPAADVAADVPARELELAARAGHLAFVGDPLRKGGQLFRARTVLAPIGDGSARLD